MQRALAFTSCSPVVVRHLRCHRPPPSPPARVVRASRPTLMATHAPMNEPPPAKMATPVDIRDTTGATAAALDDAAVQAKAPAAGKIEAVVPSLVVNDMAASLAFYIDVLGFQMEFGIDHGGQRTPKTADAWASIAFAMLSDTGERQDNGMLMLEVRNVESPAAAAVGQGPLGVGAYLYVRGLDPHAVRAALPPTVEVVTPPHDEWYGMVEMVLKDPSGYFVTVGRRSETPPAAMESAEEPTGAATE